MRMDGKKKMMGFYTNRYVVAENPKEAETQAVDMIKSDEKLKGNVLNKTWQKKPMIYAEEMYEIEESEIESQSGYTFFDMDEK